MNQTFYHSLAADLKAGDSVHLLTILSGTRDTRDLTAQKALLHAGCVSAYDETLTDFWQQLSDHLPDGAAPRTVEMNGVRLLVEQICSRQKLVICGGGHIAFPLVALGTMLDFDVTVIDDRPEFANAERFPAARNVLCQPFEQALTALEYTDSSYFVIVTRGHENDRYCLEQILHHRFAYCGMIGSRKKVAVVMEQMAREGFDKALLEQVHAPIGLKIGAQTPAEIAVCIAAEIIQTRSGASDGGFDPAALDRLANGEPMMLATILEKRGSAPRGVGAKLLVDSAGKLYGTIGGGAAEAQVLALSPEILHENLPRIVECNMTNDDARQSGMVCGGIITVLLEPIQ